MNKEIQKLISELAAAISSLPLAEQVAALNETRLALHAVSPFRDEPVDCVLWVDNETVQANNYNPNKVAGPELRLLELSITADGYTQPIVTNPEEGTNVVVDGFHRNRIGKECRSVKERVKGYLPIVHIRAGRAANEDRMASTIRHNRARGKHQVDAMTDIVLELSRRNWSDAKISKELGMEPDEVLRFKQIGGLADLFKDQEFSKAWEIDIS